MPYSTCVHTGINGAYITTSSLTATSVTISWSPQPAQFRLQVVEYTVSLTRVNGSGQVLCVEDMDSKPAVTTTNTSMSFTDLEEFSTYTVTVTTTFNVFGSNMDVASDMMFTTSSAGMYFDTYNWFYCNYVILQEPTEAPFVDVDPIVTSRSVNVTWDVIECIERNGIITNYTVVFNELDGTAIPGEVMGQSFTATELTPYTSYTFQVAGVSINGAGPFSDVTTILTDEDGLLTCNIFVLCC